MATPDVKPQGDEVGPTLITLVDDFANITDVNNATVRELPIVSDRKTLIFRVTSSHKSFKFG